MTSEERKEARAHRNRIAAQTSRDRRKAHYSNLEQRVAELEEENRILRANQLQFPTPVPRSAEEEQERDKARDRENEELRERIKTLEKGWDAVVKALAAQGLPTGIPLPPPAIPSPPDSPITFPVIVPNTTVYPLSPSPSHTSLSTGSFDFEFDVAESESTRQLAAGGHATNQHHHLSIELPTDSHDETETVSDAAMEDLFREILTSPISPTASLPPALDTPSPSTQFQIASAPPPAQMMVLEQSVVDWEGDAEMRRLLSMLPDVQSSLMDGTTTVHTQPALEFDLELEWDMERSATLGAEIGVF
jgi:hypothetical protein